MKQEKPLYYADYLELDKILTAQHPRSKFQLTIPSHDETLFIFVHQAFELWFLQIRHELKSVIDLLAKTVLMTTVKKYRGSFNGLTGLSEL